MLIIGSRAAHYYINGFRKPHDWDVICTPEEYNSFLKSNPELKQYVLVKHSKKSILRTPRLQVEFEIAIPGSSGEELLNRIRDCEFNLKLLPNDKFPVKFAGKISIASPEILYLIKKSHVGYQIHWDKNIQDYSFLQDILRKADKEFITLALEKFISMRALEMKARFSKRKKIDLDRENSQFFNVTQGSVKRKYSHDLLHKYTCYYDRPLYEKLKVDKSKAAVDEGLWNRFSYEDKLKAIREEAFAIALERKIIPAKEKNQAWDRTAAFRWALMRISTNLTDGFFQQFALDNHKEIMQSIPAFDDMFFSKIALAV